MRDSTNASDFEAYLARLADPDLRAAGDEPTGSSARGCISGASPPVARSELAVHLQALATVPTTQSFTVTVFGGPAFFSVQQHLVTDVSFGPAYAFDTATFSSAAIDRRSGSTVGFHVGADIAHYFTDTAGAGWLTRYSRGRLELPSVGDVTLELETGGLPTAWGLRMRF